MLGPDDHREAHASDAPDVRARLASVGRPLPTVEVEVQTDAGRGRAAVPSGAPVARLSRNRSHSRSQMVSASRWGLAQAWTWMLPSPAMQMTR